jgi:hypothetical protein
MAKKVKEDLIQVSFTPSECQTIFRLLNDAVKLGAMTNSPNAALASARLALPIAEKVDVAFKAFKPKPPVIEQRKKPVAPTEVK